MENQSHNQTPKPLNRLNKTLVQRPFNPLYDGKIDDGTFKFNQLYLIPIMCLLVLLYLNLQEKETPLNRERELSTREKILNNEFLFDEDGHEIAEIGTKTDPHNYVDSMYSPAQYNDKSVREKGIYASNSNTNSRKVNRAKPPKRTILTDFDSLKNSLVFAGSFVNKDNAERVLNRLKTMGYDKAEIVMKEKLPYKVVVTGFHNHEGSAKKEVHSLEKRGIDVYSTSNNLDEIYRNKTANHK